jgi:mycoredoxin
MPRNLRCVAAKRQRNPTSDDLEEKHVSRGPLTIYSTVWCGWCRRLKAQMEREGIDFVEVDIEHDPAAAETVMAVNGGNQTVPTLVFPDGSALSNPSLAQVKAHLAA